MLLERRLYQDHPLPGDVLLLVEVSDTTLTKDRLVKLPLYAEAGIPEVWIVNLGARQIEVYLEPKEREYLTRQTYALSASFAPRAFPDKVHPWLPEALLELL